MPITSLIRRLGRPARSTARVPADPPVRAAARRPARRKAASALGTAAVLAATALVAGAPSATASTAPSSRCPAGKFCVFKDGNFGGAMTTYSTSQPTLGSWDNSISSMVNNTGLHIVLYDGPDYTSGDMGGMYLSPNNGAVDLTREFEGQWDNFASSIRLAYSDFEAQYGTQYMDWDNASPRPAGLPAVSQFGDLDNNGRPDLLERAYGGKLWFLPGDGTGQLIGSGWDKMTKLVRHGDYNGDGREDIYARDTTGVLWFYPGNGKGAFGTRVRIGAGWNSMRQLAAVGDLSGDGRRDLVAADTAGVLWLYPGNGKGAFGARVKIGNGGWNAMNALVGVGDANGDGKSDLLARDTSHNLWLYPGNGRNGLVARTQVDGTWAAEQEIFATGDLDGDGFGDLARGFPGEMHHYSGTGTGTFVGLTADMPWDGASYVWVF
ncbi:FG-GAP-like repeat-containing protein [Streptomyces sp. NPDC021224]|uniref:FG-GAP-like repeat-containing protein n=1 Tax=unclassified Streptomyces TaxID=2593676 RepID=UPI0037B4FD34